ncbi:MAG: threonine-phosphate decarboxylase CobD [Clostridium sp.]
MNLGHGGNVEEISRIYGINKEEIIDFSSNINPLGLCKRVKEEMLRAIDEVEKYPDITYQDLKDAISLYECTKVNNIVIGNGAGEVIFNIVRALSPKKALLLAPSFSEYADALESVNCEIKYNKYGEDFRILESFLDNINDDIDIIFICNPNNPTGVLTTREFIERALIRGMKTSTTIVVDESFLDFVENKNDYTLINLIDKYSNLIVVKSLTKFFAFPGIRIGYGVTENLGFINKINKSSPPWNVNTLAKYGAIVALREEDYIKKSIDYVEGERDFLYNKLLSFKEVLVYRPSVNYIFFRCLKDIDLREELIKFNILIRDCSNYKYLDKGYYRVAVRTRHENIELIKSLKEVLG